jgi:hypothetical protein
MNWDLILTMVGVLTTLVLFTPIFVAFALAYHKAKMNTELEIIRKNKQVFHPSNSDFNWEDIFEGDKP